MADETLLAAAPSDGISCVSFSPLQTEMLLVSSWDATTRLYDVYQNMPKFTFNFNGACLSNCFANDGPVCFTGGLDCSIHSLELTRGTRTLLGSHRKAVSSIQYNSESNSLFSGSWDGTVVSWDVRSANDNPPTIRTDSKIFSLATSNHRVVIATSSRKVLVYDIRNLSEAEQVKDSPLKHQIRKIATHPDGTSFAMGSTEGRVAIEYFDSSPEVQAKKYAFKCHRRGDVAYPVNAIAFHPQFGTFATGGCDGNVSIWDGANKKRLSQLRQYPTSIASLAFSNDGGMLAIAASYTFEEGEKAKVDDNVFIKRIDQSEVKPKSKAT